MARLAGTVQDAPVIEWDEDVLELLNHTSCSSCAARRILRISVSARRTSEFASWHSADDVAARRVEGDRDRELVGHRHGRTNPPCARTRPPLCGASSSVASAAAIVIAAQSSGAEIITAETTCGLARA